MHASSGTMSIFLRMADEALGQLRTLGLDSYGEALQAGLSDCRTILGTWSNRVVPMEEQREVIDKVTRLAIAVGAYVEERKALI
jgi:hypothetical protein